ncbi:MAG: hypothetical protein ACYSWU_26765 [Planctomycetota bacterium]|jgi:hypothetical protein
MAQNASPLSFCQVWGGVRPSKSGSGTVPTDAAAVMPYPRDAGRAVAIKKPTTTMRTYSVNMGRLLRRADTCAEN